MPKDSHYNISPLKILTHKEMIDYIARNVKANLFFVGLIKKSRFKYAMGWYSATLSSMSNKIICFGFWSRFANYQVITNLRKNGFPYLRKFYWEFRLCFENANMFIHFPSPT